MEILHLDGDQASAVADVLCEAFRDYPVMRYVLGQTRDYDERLRRLVEYFVDARLYRGEIMLGIRLDDAPDDALAAAALVSKPDSVTPPEMTEAREQLWRLIGSDARRRYETFGRAAGSFELPEKHLHLNMIGVRRAVQGRGFGRALMEAVHGLSVSDPESAGVSLTTELEENVPLYEHFGYREVGSRSVDRAFTTHVFFRADE